jgi:YfiH family protein
VLPRQYALDDGRSALVRFTGCDEGDLSVDGPADALATRRRAVVDRPWFWLRQVHGGRVVDADGGEAPGGEADAALTGRTDVVLAVQTADCAPVALIGRAGVVAVAHAGWRGLLAGVLEATVAAMRARDAGEVVAVLGPCIHAECYEFGSTDLAALERVHGPEVRSVTVDGRPALDLPAAVAAALRHSGVPLDAVVDRCTACDLGYYSHRARSSSARQAGLVWLVDE